MQILPAQSFEAQAIWSIFQACTQAMLAANIKQWDGNYPDLAQIQLDIEQGEAWVIHHEQEPLATITLNAVQDAQYQNIDWTFHPAKVLVIHRLAVHPEAQGRGYARRLCTFAEDYATNHGYGAIRLDAYSENPISNRMYEKLGYRKAEGVCWFHSNQAPFYCYEKQIEQK